MAEIVQQRLFASDGDECMLLAWCVMPNHLHIVCELSDDVELWRLVKSWKGSTGLAANRVVGRRGAFWYREYHDRFIRDEIHLANAIRYVERNPVEAGLCLEPGEWAYSSARWRAVAE